jgi:hypothetical protein
VHGVKPAGALSSLHWKLAPASDVNVKVATLTLEEPPFGPAVMVVCGGDVSTVNDFCATAPVPPVPIARTEKVKSPCPSWLYGLGDVQAEKPAVRPGPVSSHS